MKTLPAPDTALFARKTPVQERSPLRGQSSKRIGTFPGRQSDPQNLVAVNAESDEDLMARLARNEHSALETLLDRYARIITGVIFNVVRDEAETEEVLMEVFLHSWKIASQYSPAKGKALGWLVTMARRRGIDRLRKRQRYSAATGRLQVAVEHDPEAWIAPQNAEKDTECSDLRSFIRAKLNDLPVAQREVIEFTFYQGMSQREIAAQTGIPLGTVKTRIELGLKKLSTSLHTLSKEF